MNVFESDIPGGSLNGRLLAHDTYTTLVLMGLVYYREALCIVCITIYKYIFITLPFEIQYKTLAFHYNIGRDPTGCNAYQHRNPSIYLVISNPQKTNYIITVLIVCIQLREDTDFMFEWQEQ